VPLVQLDGILRDVSAELRGCVAVGPVSLGELGLIVDTVGLHEALHVAPGLVESVLHLVDKREIVPLGKDVFVHHASQVGGHWVLH